MAEKERTENSSRVESFAARRLAARTEVLAQALHPCFDMPTNAIQVLKDHHNQISGLFELIRRSPDLKEKLTLFQELKDELEVHSVLEEKIFYPAISSFDEVSDQLDRAYEIDDELSDLVEEVDQMEIDSVEGDNFDVSIDDFDDAIDEVQRLYSAHVEQNEKEIYPEAMELLEDDDLTALANQMNEIRGLGMAA